MSFFRSTNSRKSSGFTLIELLVVIAIVGLLAGAMITLIDPVRQLQRSRDSKRKSELKQIQTGLELYRSDVGSYPPSVSSSTPLQDSDRGVIYLQTVPKDPKGLDYYYVTNATGSTYSLTACAENTSDKESKTASDTTSPVVPPAAVSYYGSDCPSSKNNFFVVTNP